MVRTCSLSSLSLIASQTEVILLQGRVEGAEDLPRGGAGQSAPPVASMSRATAAVQDCSPEPSASPVNGSKYSAKPPSESSSRVSRRILWARSFSPARSSDHQNSQLATGHTGPRQ